MSEQLLDALAVLNALPGNHLILLPNTPTFTIVGVTDAYLQVTYTQREDILGKGLFEALTDDVNNPLATGVANLSASLHQVVAHKSPHQMERQRYDVFHPQSSVFVPKIWEPVNQPVLTPGGQVQYIIHTVVDVTEQVLTHQKLEESEVALQNAVELAQLGLWTLEIATGIMQLSHRQAHMFGVDSAEILRDQILMIIHPDDRQRVQEAILRAQQPGGDGRYEAEYRILNHQTGKQQIIRSLGKTTFNVAGKPLRIAGTTQDVTLERELQQGLEEQVQQRTGELGSANEKLVTTNEELVQANGLLARSNESLQTFAYVASHDLQEPLRKIQAFGDLLKIQHRHQLGEGIIHLDRMQSAANRMSMLIRDLLNYSRISNQQDTSGPVALDSIVEQVLSTLEMTIEETGAHIEVAPLPIITGDAMQLGQMFQNLLSNALKFRRPDVIPKVIIRSAVVPAAKLPPSVKPIRRADSYYRIEVTDNGIGFDVKYVGRIFQVFQRLHGRSEFAGTGIGLSICEKVAINHGGAITAYSQPGQGATFSVYLPA